MPKTPEKQITSIGVGFVIAWLLSLGCLLLTLGSIGNSSTYGAVLFFLAGLSINPTFWSITRSKLNFQLSGF